MLIVLAGSRFGLTALEGEVNLSGVVTSASGDPVLRAQVHVYDVASADTIATLFTDEQGRYQTTVTGVDAETVTPAPTEYAVGKVAPNPLSASEAGRRVTLRYTTSGNRSAKPTLEVYDVLGRRAYPAQSLAAGLYFYRLRFENGERTGTHRFMLTDGGRVRFDLVQARTSLDAVTAEVGAAAAGKKAAAGTVRLVVEKSGYVTKEVAVEVTGDTEHDVTLDAADPPTAAFEVSGPAQGGEATRFDASASTGASESDSLTYHWAFGDDGRAGGQKTAHIYTTGDTTFTVTLTVAGAYGATDTTKKTISISAPPAPTGTADVMGVVTGAQGDSLSGVTVATMGESVSATTNDSGIVRLSGIATGAPVTLRTEKDGYATQRVRLNLPEDAESGYFRATLTERDTTAMIEDVETGGMVSGPDGVQVEVPVEGLVREDGTVATGDVDVGLTSVDVSDNSEIGAFPGSFSGVTPEGEAELIMSYGVSEYDFSQGGADLDLAPGKTATIEIPIYVGEDLNGEAVQVGNEYPLWALNEETGDWVQEGMGTVVEAESSPTGFALRGEVSHFSWWNHDIAPDPYRPIPECKIRDEDGLPTIDLDETCYIDGRLVGPNGPQSRANTNIPPGGGVPLPVPPDRDVRLTAFAQNGTLAGEMTVNGSAGRSEVVEVVLDPIDRGGKGEQIALDTSFAAAIDPAGEVDRYTFRAEKDSLIHLTVEASPDSDLEGTVSLLTSDGELIKEGDFQGAVAYDPEHVELGLLIPETGDYVIEVEGTRYEPGGYQVTLESLDVAGFISPNTNVSGTVASNSKKRYVFEADSGTVVQSSVFGSSGASSYVQTVGRQSLYDYRVEFGEMIPKDGHYILTVDAENRDGGDFTTGLAVVEPPQPLSFDAQGRSTHRDTVSIYGDIQLYSLDASAGDGFIAELAASGSEPLDTDAEVRLYRQGNGDSFDPESWLRDGNDTVYRAFPADADSTLSALGAKLPGSGDDTYLIVVSGRSASPGSYALRAEYVPEATQLTADDDLTECPNADTRSLRAALLAADENATVTACAGTYSALLEAQIFSTGVSLTGADREDVVVESRSGQAIEFSVPSVAISDLTVVSAIPTSGGRLGTPLILGRGREATLDHLRLGPGEGVTEIGTAVDLEATQGALRNLNIDSAQTALNLSGDSLLIENNTLSASNKGIDYEEGVGAVIRRNTISGTDSFDSKGIITEGSNTGSLTIINNEVVLPGEGRGIQVTETGSPTDTSRVAGNRVSFLGGDQDDEGIVAVPNSENSVIMVENNHVTMNDNRGATGLRAYGGQGDLIVRNNVIDNAGFEGMRLRYVEEYDRILIANNTLRSASGSSADDFRSLILAARSGQTGALPITLVNNIFEGQPGQDVAVKVPAGATIDSDYNLFYDYGTVYEGGTTSTGANDITGQEPLFENDLLEVEAGSPAVDAGASPSDYPGVPAADYDSTARPQGSGYDIGAHER